MHAVSDRVPPTSPRAVPAMIAGYPTVIVAHDVGPIDVALVSVDDLETHVDRDRILRGEGGDPPYWALLWSGALEMARLLATDVDCAGKTLLDVGCGLGITSLVAARRGAIVTAIDRELAAIEFVQASAQVNAVAIEAVVGDVTEVRLARRYDLVVAAELLYDATAFDRIGAALVAALAPGGSLWIADAGRVGTQLFYEGLERRGLAIHEVLAREVREEGTLVRVRLIELRRASPVRT